VLNHQKAKHGLGYNVSMHSGHAVGNHDHSYSIDGPESQTCAPEPHKTRLERTQGTRTTARTRAITGAAQQVHLKAAATPPVLACGSKVDTPPHTSQAPDAATTPLAVPAGKCRSRAQCLGPIWPGPQQPRPPSHSLSSGSIAPQLTALRTSGLQTHGLGPGDLDTQLTAWTPAACNPEELGFNARRQLYSNTKAW